MLREKLTVVQRSTFLGLLAWFNQRRARDNLTAEQAQEAAIPPGDLLTITLADELQEARKRLQLIRKRFELTIRRRGEFTWVRWPNLAEFQEWDRPQNARRTPGERPEDALSDSDSDSDSEEEKKDPPTPPPERGGKARSRSPVAATDPPEELPSQDQAALVEWALKNGFSMDECQRATATVLDWGRSNGKRKKSWLATVRNAMRAGWALERAKGNGGAYRETPDTTPPGEAERDERFRSALASLKTEDDRDYSVAEVEARMAKAAS